MRLPLTKILLGEIASHDSNLGYHVSNKHLVGILGIGERQIRTCISLLREKGFVTVRFNSHNERIIRLTVKLARRTNRLSQSPNGQKSHRKPAARSKRSSSR